MEASFGLRVRNASYRRIVEQVDGEEISEQSAGRDLKAMVDAGLLEASGRNRARYYGSTEILRERWQEVRASRPPRDEFDPFVAARERLSPRLEL